MDKIEKDTNDIVKGIITVKNEKLIGEHIEQVDFRNDVMLESHFDSLHGVTDDVKIKIDRVLAKLNETKYSTEKKSLIMEVIKQHNFNTNVIDIITAIDQSSMSKAVVSYKAASGAYAFTNLISNMKALGLG